MCGIAGIWRPSQQASPDEMVQMLSAMRHRGPEGAAYARLDQGAMVFGFLALAFTDAPTSLQPLFNENYNMALVYNGEIYDFEPLRVRLQAQGHQFRTRSDSEVILHLYEQHGLDFFQYLNGEFAFVIWDGVRGELLCVRDRFGVKPLYTVRLRNGFAFASEIKALLALPEVSAALEPSWFSGPGIGLAETSRTPFAGVIQVRPGHVLRVGRHGATQTRWWNPDFTKHDWDAPTAAEALRAELTHAVRRRIGGDVPIALSLSSGIDSTIVSGLAAEVRGRLPAYTLSYPGAFYDEAETARTAARHHGHDFTPVDCRIPLLAEGLLTSIWATEMPTNSLSTAARMRLTAAVRADGHKALAGGEGADELFGGYPYFGLEFIWRMLASEDQKTRRRGQAELRRFQQEESWSKAVFWDGGRGWKEDSPRFGTPTVYAQRATRAKWLQRLILSRDFRHRAGDPMQSVENEFDTEELRALGPFDATRMISRSVVSTFAIPALGDRVEMSASLEGRAPYLDQHIIALAHRLPEHLCIDPQSLIRKAVLRQAGRDLIPLGHRAQPKHTYMAPTFAELVQTNLGKELFEHYVSDAMVRSVGVYSPLAVRTIQVLWRRAPRESVRFLQLDGILGFILSVHALHDLYVNRGVRRGHDGVLSGVVDRTPVPFAHHVGE